MPSLISVEEFGTKKLYPVQTLPRAIFISSVEHGRKNTHKLADFELVDSDVSDKLSNYEVGCRNITPDDPNGEGCALADTPGTFERYLISPTAFELFSKWHCDDWKLFCKASGLFAAMLSRNAVPIIDEGVCGNLFYNRYV